MTKAPVKSTTKTPRKPAAKAAVKPAVKTSRKAAAKPVVTAAPKPNLTVVPQVVASVAPTLDPAQTHANVTVPTPTPDVEDVIKATHILKLRELVEQVAAASGAKRKGLKEVVEATLAAMGAALSRGDELNLPPLGKLKVGRQKAMGEGEMIVIRLRRGPVAASRAQVDEKDDLEALAVADD